MSSPRIKRVTGFVLVIALLVPLALCSGCATTKKSGSPFTFPTWKNEQKPKKPKKDPGTPVTMGEAMMLPRNDVL